MQFRFENTQDYAVDVVDRRREEQESADNPTIGADGSFSGFWHVDQSTRSSDASTGGLVRQSQLGMAIVRLFVIQALAGKKTKIPQSHVIDVFKYAGLRGVSKSAVLDNHVFNFCILKADKIERPAALLGSHILQIDVPHSGMLLTAILIILKIDADHGLFHLTDANSTNEQIFEIPAPSRIGF